MKNLADSLRAAGANDVTINTFFLSSIAFMFLVGLGSFGFCLYLTIIHQDIPAWLLSLVGAAFGSITVLGTSSHTATTINGTAAKTASATAVGAMQATKSDQLSPELLAALSQLVTNVQTTATATASMPAQVTATQENTAAVKENTAATQAAGHSG